MSFVKFGGSLARNARFGSFLCQFWRKSRETLVGSNAFSQCVRSYVGGSNPEIWREKCSEVEILREVFRSRDF